MWDDFLVGGIVFASFKEKQICFSAESKDLPLSSALAFEEKKICFSVGRTHHVADRRLEVMRGIREDLRSVFFEISSSPEVLRSQMSMTPSELFFTLNETLDSGGRILICRRDEKAVGILIYSVFEDLMTYNLLGYIELVFVMPHFRGKGVAKKLLSFATNDLSGEGVDETFFECVFDSDYHNWSKAVGMSEFSILLEKSLQQ
ncbi:hypothetical protein V511_01785 [Mesotoga sp. Brook.08.YT.4.2.5.1]|nr:hypothetical protein V511_01785 [Mesotoga sp. Brook.08.YT.4.2.5.1]PVD16727.1 hypothetical protein V512_007320 [Mesotoga sp. Brook.08.105.5.1]RAO95616.1 hypothetical protein M388_03750 [Mesotoga sp. Brook.08.YT.4.2.5.4.]RDI92198.1 hypothetical protein Q502_09960 [Mesotoga sp. Brook.08.YT.4.2.5.2.]